MKLVLFFHDQRRWMVAANVSLPCDREISQERQIRGHSRRILFPAGSRASRGSVAPSGQLRAPSFDFHHIQ